MVGSNAGGLRYKFSMSILMLITATSGQVCSFGSELNVSFWVLNRNFFIADQKRANRSEQQVALGLGLNLKFNIQKKLKKKIIDAILGDRFA